MRADSGMDSSKAKASEAAGGQGVPPAARVKRGVRVYLQQNAVLLLTLLGVVLGFAIGFGVRELKPSGDALLWIGMPGELFLRMLYLMIVPLVASSVITGTASLDPKSNSKLGVVAFVWITATNLLACILGVVLSVTIKPGESTGSGASGEVSSPFETQDIFADLLRNIIPNNIVEVAFRKARTEYSTSTKEAVSNSTNGTEVVDIITTRSRSVGKTDSVNVLGLIFISALMGMAANRLGERANVFIDFFAGATEIVLVVMRWFFWTTPLGVASLIAKAIASVDDVADSFSKLGMFVVVVTVGVLIHQLVVLSLLLFALTRRNPLTFHLSILRPYFIAFAATSTAVALPEMIHCCEVKNKVDSRVTRFAVPFSVTLSANGSAVFIVSAAIFIAQYIDVPLSASDVVVITVLTAVSAMALPSVPSSSLVTLVIILAALNIPGQIELLFAVEWYLDRIRSGTNVVSHCYCAAVSYQFVKNDLERRDLADEKGLEHRDSERRANGRLQPKGETNDAYSSDYESISTQM